MNCILASSSKVHKMDYLEHLIPSLKKLFKDVEELVFIPFARPGGISHTEYTKKAKRGLEPLDLKVKGLHEFKDYKDAVEEAEAIFIGGGNTFVLTETLHKSDLIDTLRNAVKGGTPYLGTSAGSNVAGQNIKTTNDMPIIYPPSFEGLGLVDFNLNPHYIEREGGETHQGETRITRIEEFHKYNSIPVVGLPEKDWLLIDDQNIILKGAENGVVFERNQSEYTIKAETSLQTLR
jgi:dipeptidase E